jgi:uncharacterized membrane protein YvbJ
MVERVSTGGNVSFDYSGKGIVNGELSAEKKRSIHDGYVQAEERKRKQRYKRIIMWTIVIFLILLFGFIFFG